LLLSVHRLKTTGFTASRVSVTLYFPTKNVYLIDKGKAIPLQAWTGPEGSRTLKLPDFKTIGT
jgi:hypothetical protein